MDEAKAVVVVRDAALASSLELALLAAGMTPVLFDPSEGLEHLPLGEAAVLIVGPQALSEDPAAFVERLRSRGWLGLVILITGDCPRLRRIFKGADRVAVLEMPFVGADLIAAIRSFRQG